MKKYKFTKLQEAWLTALETGKIGKTRYKQTTGTLCRLDKKDKPEGYCCLGVACEVYNMHAPDKDKLAVGVTGVNTRLYDDMFGFLPEKVRDALKMHGNRGNIHLPEDAQDIEHNDLSECNDDDWSHAKIAKFIRDNPHAVFK